MTFTGERIVTYKGKKRKFYLYRIDMSSEDETIMRLGIAGPYSIQPAKMQTEASETGIYWDKEYDAASVSRDLKEYLEAYEKAEEQP
jgi:hypothetical protein